MFWGKGSNKGVLQGRRSGRIIDFREQIGVYVLYDNHGGPSTLAKQDKGMPGYSGGFVPTGEIR